MDLAETPRRFGAHRNAFGFLRLLFASLVIVSHVPEVVDGGTQREILHNLTGTTTFGGFAVKGFFVISGYLITGSFLASASLRSYLIKRIARIYPAFIAASAVCLIIVVPLSGGAHAGTPLHVAFVGAARMLMLARPAAEHPFAGQNYSDRDAGLDGAMWTIQYEFACYLMIVLIGALGLLRRRWPVPVLAMASIGIGTFAASLLPGRLSHSILFPGPPGQLFVLPGLFLAGATANLYRHQITFSPTLVTLAAGAFVLTLLNATAAPFGFAVFGTYLILAAARAGAANWIGRINDRTDISYGLYLYGWPVIMLLIRYRGASDLVMLGMEALCASALAGWLSWMLVERPVLRFIGDRRRTSDEMPPVAEAVDHQSAGQPQSPGA